MTNVVSKIKNDLERRADKEQREKAARIQEMQKKKLSQQNKETKDNND